MKILKNNFVPYYKVTFLILLLLFSGGLFAQIAERTERIDTLYVVPDIEGGVSFNVDHSFYWGGTIQPGEGAFYAGDTFDSFDGSGNSSMRSFFSFAIEQMPINSQIQNVTLHLYQRFCTGNWASQVFPIWYGGLYYPCMVAHINYGNTVELSDFNPGELTDIGIISDNNVPGWRTIDITNDYMSDLTLGRQYCQLMLYFHIACDYDDNPDWVAFDDAFAYHPEAVPKLIIQYEITDGNDDQTSHNFPLSIYPNPARTSFHIKSDDGTHLNKVEIFNLRGQTIAFEKQKYLRNEVYINFDRIAVPSGLYFVKCTMEGNGKTITRTRKLMVL
jgi:hypothetical protein